MPEAVAQISDVMHVMAGVMRDPIGRVLLAQRPAGASGRFGSFRRQARAGESLCTRARMPENWASNCNVPNH